MALGLPRTTPKREFGVEGSYSYDRRGPLRWLGSHLLRYPLLLVSFVVSALLTNVLFAAVPRLTGTAFDEVLRPEPSARRLLGIAAVVLGIVLVRGVVDIVNSFSVETLGQRLERDARDELYLSLLGKSQTFHNRQRVGDIMARAGNDVRQLNPMMNPGVALITESLLGIAIPLVFIGLIDPRLLASPLLFVIAFGFALRRYTKRLNPVSAALRQRFGAMNAGLNEAVVGIEVVKGAAQEAQEKRKFVRDAALYRDAFTEQGAVQARYLPLLLIGFALSGAFAHGLFLLSRDQISVGDLVAYLGLMSVLRFPAFISIFTFSLVQLGIAGAERILELIREDTELDENAGGHSAPIRGEITFQNVSFAYGGEGSKMSLQGLSFRAEPGQTVAVVGQTGSGKSTLTKLVNRAYDTTEGRILIDGVDVREWNLETLRSQISVIEQDIFLFSRSVSSNIAFGVGDATPEAIKEAAKAAQADGFIRNFRDGYATVIGEQGVTLSGGQRQRLAIARALLTDPRILILDDSTSAVDSATEDEIQGAINRVTGGRTTLLITHRLSQIRRADKILVLHQGELIDEGTHDELLARCALYGRIFARQ